MLTSMDKATSAVASARACGASSVELETMHAKIRSLGNDQYKLAALASQVEAMYVLPKRTLLSPPVSAEHIKEEIRHDEDKKDETRFVKTEDVSHEHPKGRKRVSSMAPPMSSRKRS
jgi:hypothetical protein